MRLSILGSTGSIGCNTLQVVREMAGAADVVALTAGKNVDQLVEQAVEFRPELVSLGDQDSRDRFSEQLRSRPEARDYRPEILAGPQGNLAAARDIEYDTLVSAAVGVAGLPGTFEAVRAGKRVALANKECLVAAGELLMNESRRSGAEILPVDSEHNAAHQCFRAGRREEVDRLILTASGGPFRLTPAQELENVGPEQALAHPTWKMGARISIDSATMMNKGFEVIEACRLFDLPPERVQVVVHPQSIVHAMVEYCDGSVIAQLGPADMKLPIRYALAYPHRQPGVADRRLSWDRVRQLDFQPPDFDKFPLLRLAYGAVETGGGAGCVLNAADEVAVSDFLGSKIPFHAIPAVVEATLEQLPVGSVGSIEETLEIDREARRIAVAASAEHRVRASG